MVEVQKKTLYINNKLKYLDKIIKYTTGTIMLILNYLLDIASRLKMVMVFGSFLKSFSDN